MRVARNTVFLFSCNRKVHHRNFTTLYSLKQIKRKVLSYYLRSLGNFKTVEKVTLNLPLSYVSYLCCIAFLVTRILSIYFRKERCYKNYYYYFFFVVDKFVSYFKDEI